MKDSASEQSDAFPNTLSHIIYASAASENFHLEQLPELIEIAQRNNARMAITGLLTYSDGCFFQVLEGEEKKLNALYEIIRKDPRHENLVIIVNEPIARRSFSDWSMRFADTRTVAEREMDYDLRAFFDDHRLLTGIDEGKARKLVAAFEAGRWRMPTVPVDQEIEENASFGEFSMAFQPIVDTRTRTVYSHEALVRGPSGEPAYTVLNAIAPEHMAGFDFAARSKAVRMAADLRLGTALNLNFIPSAVLNPETSLKATLEIARACGFPAEDIMFEAIETEFVGNLPEFPDIVREMKRFGIELAIDDFGAGHAGLKTLADFQPDYVKLDMALVRDIDSKAPRQAIARAIAQLCEELGINLIVEGVETTAEYRWLRQLGVHLFQGFLFAKPMFEGRPLVRFPAE